MVNSETVLVLNLKRNKMKRTVLIIVGVLSLLFLFVNCNNETEEEVKGGIEFQPLTFDAAIAKGKASHKIVFIDAYATWCGPCKQLSKKTFVDKKVAELFNAKFVNVKMDVDQAEGKKFAEKFEINSIPTLLFFDENGKLLKQVKGFHTPNELIQEANSVLGK